MRILSLFSGGGGLDLGIHRAVPGSRTVCYVEREAYACAVLLARMADGGLAPAPIWTDVTTFDGRPWRGVVDCVAGGSPCQDLSVAGKRAGLDGERSGLFFQFVRIVEEVRPGYVFWENVGGATSALPRVFDAFAALGYSGKAVKIRASDVGASHQRARIFLLGRLADAVRPHQQEEHAGDDALDEQREAERWRAEQSAGAGAGGRAPQRGDSSGASPVGEPTSGGGAVLAQPGSSGWFGHGRGGPSQAERGRSFDQTEGPDLGLGDPGDISSAVLEEERRPGSTVRDAARCGEELADSGDARREGRERAGAPCESEGASRPASERGRPEWPPGPGGDWSAVDPRFFPAQPRLRGVADGMAGGLDAAVASVWADRLRCLGNGVVPAQAAEAWRFLSDHLDGGG